jgi:septal ring factor EnvC (AmiA/AmiB activator)
MKCRKLNKSLNRFSSRESFLAWFPALLVAALLTAGMIPLWPQDSEPKSNSFSGILPGSDLSLETLNKLHDQASNQLTGLTQDLNLASRELQASKTQLTSLQNSLGNALRKSTDLEATNQRISDFNRQIGERMRERDEDLASAYEEINGKDKQILKLWIAVVVLGLGCLGFVAFGVIKLLIKLHIL